MSVKWVSVDDLTAGMLVHKAVADKDGRIIIPQGGRLTPMAIKRLPRWGVLGADILFEDGIDNGEEAAEQPRAPERRVEADTSFIERIEKTVDERFAGLAASQFNDEYKALIKKYLIEKGRGVIPGL